MSVLGTGIAAGVANTTQSARQAAQQRSGESAGQAGNARNSDKITLSQLHGASEARDTDQDMPDQQAPGYENLYDEAGGEDPETPQAPPDPPGPPDPVDQIHQADAPACSPTGLPLSPTYGPSTTARRAPLFHRFDVTG